MDLFLSKTLDPVKCEVSGKAPERPEAEQGHCYPAAFWALHLGAITDPLLRWPAAFSAHLAPGFASRFQSSSAKTKLTACVLQCLPYKSQLPIEFPLKLCQISSSGGTFCDFFVKGFLSTGPG